MPTLSIPTRLRNTYPISSHKKHNSAATQAIRNDVSPTLDFYHNAHKVDHRTGNHLILQEPPCTPFLYGFSKIYKTYLSSALALM